uniref:Uncharacterized protein n=1 Tax=viral metagenome TaxID=1070528 RepID=A0A6C0DE86_9ZZZZ
MITDEKPVEKSGDKRKRVSIVGNLVRSDSGTEHIIHDPLPGNVDPSEFYYIYDKAKKEHHKKVRKSNEEELNPIYYNYGKHYNDLNKKRQSLTDTEYIPNSKDELKGYLKTDYPELIGKTVFGYSNKDIILQQPHLSNQSKREELTERRNIQHENDRKLFNDAVKRAGLDINKVSYEDYINNDMQRKLQDKIDVSKNAILLEKNKIREENKEKNENNMDIANDTQIKLFYLAVGKVKSKNTDLRKVDITMDNFKYQDDKTKYKILNAIDELTEREKKGGKISHKKRKPCKTMKTRKTNKKKRKTRRNPKF